MILIHSLLLAFVIGFTAGLRTMTPLALLAWGAKLGWFPVEGRLSFLASTGTVIVTSILALVEFVTDQLPTTPSRTEKGPFTARLVLGGVCGAIVATAAGASFLPGVVAGVAGGVAGTFSGYQVRHDLTTSHRVSDHVVATIEDLLAIGLAAFVAYHVHPV